MMNKFEITDAEMEDNDDQQRERDENYIYDCDVSEVLDQLVKSYWARYGEAPPAWCLRR